MREMVLNHASLAAGDPYVAVGFLKDVVLGMAQLVEKGVTAKVLRTARFPVEIPCAPEFSLRDVMQRLRRDGARDQYGFLLGMMTKASLLSDVEADVEHRFLTCEARSLPPEDGEPLLLCALIGGVAIGFPTGVWDRDRTAVVFDELQGDGTTFSEETEEIDHLSRASHAAPICDRHRECLRAGSSPRELWNRRQVAFPNVVFGPDVEDHLEELPTGIFRTVVNRLVELDAAARDWLRTGGTMPPWTCRVTNESKSLRNNRQLRERRRFRSCSGERALFLWHARFGNNGRIHLRFDAKCREVEIGYIGPHLPL